MKAIFIDGNYEYFLVESKNSIDLFHSNSEQWSEPTRGTLALTVKVVGDYIKLPKRTLDACEQEQLRVIFAYMNRKNKEKFQIGELHEL